MKKHLACFMGGPLHGTFMEVENNPAGVIKVVKPPERPELSSRVRSVTSSSSELLQTQTYLLTIGLRFHPLLNVHQDEVPEGTPPPYLYEFAG